MFEYQKDLFLNLHLEMEKTLLVKALAGEA